VKSIANDSFWKLYHALSDDLRQEAKVAFRLFRDNPAHPGLSLERLRWGSDLWSVRITRGYRAVGQKQGDTMIWYWIGSHNEFDKKFPA
jgi:hypothetical protein